jgi:hypothetical protein
MVILRSGERARNIGSLPDAEYEVGGDGAVAGAGEEAAQ